MDICRNNWAVAMAFNKGSTVKTRYDRYDRYDIQLDMIFSSVGQRLQDNGMPPRWI